MIFDSSHAMMYPRSQDKNVCSVTIIAAEVVRGSQDKLLWWGTLHIGGNNTVSKAGQLGDLGIRRSVSRVLDDRASSMYIFRLHGP